MLSCLSFAHYSFSLPMMHHASLANKKLQWIEFQKSHDNTSINAAIPELVGYQSKRYNEHTKVEFHLGSDSFLSFCQQPNISLITFLSISNLTRTILFCWWLVDWLAGALTGLHALYTLRGGTGWIKDLHVSWFSSKFHYFIWSNLHNV